MKSKVTVNTDIQLVAMMVEKMLRDEHGVDDGPAANDYQIVGDGARLNGSRDLRIAIQISRGLAIDVQHNWPRDGRRDIEVLTSTASEIVDDITSAYEIREDIVAMMEEVCVAAAHEIAKARRRGLAYRLLSANPSVIYDRVAEGVAVEIVFERLSEALRPEAAGFLAECKERVVEVFEDNREIQTNRTFRRGNLDAAGATGRIDSVVVNALRADGHDMAQALKSLVAADEWIVDVGEPSGKKRIFRLYWDNGDVFAQITLGENASWKQHQLTFKKAPVSISVANGQPVRDIVDDPILGDVRVSRGTIEKGKYGSLRCTPDLLHFDAETGRLWAA